MEKGKMTFADWVIAGAGMAIGALLVWASVALVGAIFFTNAASKALSKNHFEIPEKTATTKSEMTVEAMPESIWHPPQKPRQRKINLPDVKPLPPLERTHTECLEKSGGVANEIYAQCRGAEGFK